MRTLHQRVQIAYVFCCFRENLRGILNLRARKFARKLGDSSDSRDLTIMQSARFCLITATALLTSFPVAAATHARHTPTSGKTSLVKHPVVKAKPHSQMSIDDQRATEIQAALIKAGYLSGSPSGHWDATTEAAMGKLQADNGWQTKLVPDSRALIKIGLGPRNDSAANGAGPLGSSLISQP
jgi:Putative peptidoglycan binding domain